MNFDPNDLIEIMKSIEDFKDVLKVVKEMLDSMVPEVMETLAPTIGYLLKGEAGADWFYYKALIEAGFTEEQAFALLLNQKTRLEELVKNSSSNKETPLIKRTGLEDLDPHF